MKPSPETTEIATTDLLLNQRGHLFFSKHRIIKNLVVLSIGCFLSCCAYNGMALLQSTLNREDGIGLITLSIQYGCSAAAGLLFSKYSLKKYGSRAVIIVTSAAYAIYVAANMYPSWYLLVPASVILGLCSSLFWAAQCQYLNDLATMYANHQIKEKEVIPFKGEPKARKQYGTREENRQGADKFGKENFAFEIGKIELKKISNNVTNQLPSNECEMEKRANQNLGSETELNYRVKESLTDFKNLGNIDQILSKIVSSYDLKIVESTTSRIFGFHGLIVQTCYVWSNLLIYYVIKSGANDDNYNHNSTCSCGADFCNVETECFLHNLQEPTEQMKYVLLGILVVIGILAVLFVSLFVDELEQKDESVNLSLEILFESFRHMKDKLHILLSPYATLIGVVAGFALGDFTKAYIGCAWGMHHVGLVIACFGAFLALSCTLSGWFVKHVGRVPIFLIGEATIVLVGVLLLKWHPDSENPAMFFGIAGLFGVNTGILWSQLRAFYGVLFKEDEEVAFGICNMFQAIGFSMAFGYSEFLCISTKIYIFLAISIIGCIGYLFVEKMHSIRKSIK